MHAILSLNGILGSCPVKGKCLINCQVTELHFSSVGKPIYSPYVVLLAVILSRAGIVLLVLVSAFLWK